METYTGENKNNMQNEENLKATDSAEDLFLPGGFDSFGGTPEPMNADMGQMNSNMGQLGSVDYGNEYGSADNSTNPWAKPIVVLSLGEQISNSFMPARYDRYKGMSEGAAKEFVNYFTRLYVRIVFLMIALMMLLTFGRVGDSTSMLIVVVMLGISYFISVFLEPYIFRFRAFVYRLIFGNLLVAITKTDISDTNMYLVSIYAGVPCIAVSILIAGIVVLSYLISPVLLYPIAAVSSTFSIIQLVVPIIIMAIAIPRMK